MDDADIYAAAETPYQRDENNYWGILDDEEEDEGDLGDLGDDPFDTAQILEQNAQQWVNLVETSGGIMAFHKCLWQIVSYYACNGWMLMRSHTQINYEMILRNGEGQTSKIKLKSANEPNKGLGYLIAPTGDQTPEYKHRLKQMKEKATKLKHAFLTRREAYIAYITRVIPAVTYPFALTRFTVKQCSDLAKVIEKVILPKMGINRNFPKAALYGPHEYGGMAFQSIETIQDQKMITHWIRHLRWGKEIGNDFKITLSAAQLISGLTTPILDNVKPDLPHLEDGVIPHLRTTLNKLGGNLLIEDVWVPKLQREEDKSIMEEFAKIPGITKQKLKAANICRIYLRVITIAELANEDGTEIEQERVTGQWRANSTLKWPRQCKPNKTQWDAFRYALRRTFYKENRNIHMPFKLTTPLGPWHPVPRHIKYDAYRDEMHIYTRDKIDGEETIPITTYEMLVLEGRQDFQKVEDEIA